MLLAIQNSWSKLFERRCFMKTQEGKMNDQYQVIVAADSGIAIHSLTDIPDVIGQCFGAEGLLITEAELSQDFFDLRTGIAGELFQKCTNYHLQLAIVIKDFAVYGERFSELIYEHRNHQTIRFFLSEVEALVWLSA